VRKELSEPLGQKTITRILKQQDIDTLGRIDTKIVDLDSTPGNTGFVYYLSPHNFLCGKESTNANTVVLKNSRQHDSPNTPSVLADQ
jgi:hypothetical protein